MEASGACIGSWMTFGNHVGDWEHVSLRLQGGQPVQIYVGVHRWVVMMMMMVVVVVIIIFSFSFGAWYDWDRAGERFLFSEGSPVVRRAYREGRL